MPDINQIRFEALAKSNEGDRCQIPYPVRAGSSVIPDAEDGQLLHMSCFLTVQILEKLFKYVIITQPDELSVNKLSSTLGRSFDSVIEYLSILVEAGLVRFLLPQESGKAHLRNPEKVYPDNVSMIERYALPNLHDQMIGKT